MDRSSAFSYACRACGRCCRDKVITLSPYDVIRIARAAGITTGAAIRRFTIRRGSLLRFDAGACVALAGSRCALHPGRPLACRLYPLGMERDGDHERFLALEPAPGSAGIYSRDGTVADFLAANETAPYFRALTTYAALMPRLRDRVAELVDPERIEPREFWRRAFREASAESGYTPNPLIDAMFDPESLGRFDSNDEALVAAHVRALETMARVERDPGRVAAAAMMLAISLGYPPASVEYGLSESAARA